MDFDPATYPHSVAVKVRFSDMDAMQHANNSRYLTFYEEARIAWFNDIGGLPVGSMDWNVIVARIEIDYLSAIAFGEDVRIYTKVIRIGSKSFDIESVMVTEGDKPRIVSKYKAVMVAFDYRSQTTLDIDDKMRKVLEATR